MRVEVQKQRLTIRNFDHIVGGGMKNKSKHGDLLPHSIRALIVGPSNSGKTNVLFNMLFDPNGLVFENIYLFSKSLYQPKYKFLKKIVPKEVGYFTYDDNTSVIHPSEAKPHSIFIFDDIACEKHDNIRNYFTMGRHNNIDTFYLGQTYSRIPKQLIRDNANLLVVFKQDETNLKHIYNDHVSPDMTFDSFKKLCSTAWADKYTFVVIDKDSDCNKGRYRLGFDQYVVDL